MAQGQGLLQLVSRMLQPRCRSPLPAPDNAPPSSHSPRRDQTRAVAPRRDTAAASNQLLAPVRARACGLGCSSAAMLSPGTVLAAKYEIQEVLGTGSNATTYR